MGLFHASSLCTRTCVNLHQSLTEDTSCASFMYMLHTRLSGVLLSVGLIQECRIKVGDIDAAGRSIKPIREIGPRRGRFFLY